METLYQTAVTFGNCCDIISRSTGDLCLCFCYKKFTPTPNCTPALRLYNKERYKIMNMGNSMVTILTLYFWAIGPTLNIIISLQIYFPHQLHVFHRSYIIPRPYLDQNNNFRNFSFSFLYYIINSGKVGCYPQLMNIHQNIERWLDRHCTAHISFLYDYQTILRPK